MRAPPPTHPSGGDLHTHEVFSPKVSLQKGRGTPPPKKILRATSFKTTQVGCNKKGVSHLFQGVFGGFFSPKGGFFGKIPKREIGP